MNSGADIGTGEEKVKAMLADVLRRLDAIDELLRPLQHHMPPLVALEVTIVEFRDSTTPATRYVGSIVANATSTLDEP
jgi:hypothetical protein